MVAKKVPEHGVEEVRRGMVTRRRLPEAFVRLRGHLVAHTQFALYHLAPVYRELRKRLGRILHLEAAAVNRYGALVTHLAAGLGVERGGVQHDLRLLALLR